MASVFFQYRLQLAHENLAFCSKIMPVKTNDDFVKLESSFLSKMNSSDKYLSINCDESNAMSSYGAHVFAKSEILLGSIERSISLDICMNVIFGYIVDGRLKTCDLAWPGAHLDEVEQRLDFGGSGDFITLDLDHHSASVKAVIRRAGLIRVFVPKLWPES